VQCKICRRKNLGESSIPSSSIRSLSEGRKPFLLPRFLFRIPTTSLRARHSFLPCGTLLLSKAACPRCSIRETRGRTGARLCEYFGLIGPREDTFIQLWLASIKAIFLKFIFLMVISYLIFSKNLNLSSLGSSKVKQRKGSRKRITLRGPKWLSAPKSRFRPITVSSTPRGRG
jgi:hypothetical protein